VQVRDKEHSKKRGGSVQKPEVKPKKEEDTGAKKTGTQSPQKRRAAESGKG